MSTGGGSFDQSRNNDDGKDCLHSKCRSGLSCGSVWVSPLVFIRNIRSQVTVASVSMWQSVHLYPKVPQGEVSKGWQDDDGDDDGSDWSAPGGLKTWAATTAFVNESCYRSHKIEGKASQRHGPDEEKRAEGPGGAGGILQ